MQQSFFSCSFPFPSSIAVLRLLPFLFFLAGLFLTLVYPVSFLGKPFCARLLELLRLQILRGSPEFVRLTGDDANIKLINIANVKLTAFICQEIAIS